MSQSKGPVLSLVPESALPYVKQSLKLFATAAGYALGVIESSRWLLKTVISEAPALTSEFSLQKVLYGGGPASSAPAGKRKAKPELTTSTPAVSADVKERMVVGPAISPKVLDQLGALNDGGDATQAKAAAHAKKQPGRKPNGDHLPPVPAATVQTVTTVTPMLKGPPEGPAQHEVPFRPRRSTNDSEGALDTDDASDEAEGEANGGGGGSEAGAKRPRRMLRKIRSIFRNG